MQNPQDKEPVGGHHPDAGRVTLLKRGLKGFIILFLLLLAAFLLRRFEAGKLDSMDALQDYVLSFGLLAPIVLTVLQAVQVVIPVLPGFLGCAVGAMLFGTWGGFLCNYIGISAGSIIAYFLARRYGIDIIYLIFSPKMYDKWQAKIRGYRYYDRFLFLATLLPLFPDDFLCYFSGLIRMDKKKFIRIIILGKPWCILVYSIIFGILGQIA
ncbi:MAG: VTT domain-containing protein [Clostridia bacterium]|nr:VTT domain-containing protein [Clostridia bacterium]